MVVGTRNRQGAVGFVKEIVTQVNKGNNPRRHFPVLEFGLDLHNTRTTKDEDGLGIRVVGTAMRTFQGVNQNRHTHLGDGGIPNRGVVPVAVRSIRHVHLGRIGNVAEVGARGFFSPFFIGTKPKVVAHTRRITVTITFTSTAVVVGTREERMAFFVPDKRRHGIVVRTVGFTGQRHVVTPGIKTVRSAIAYIDSVQLARDTGRPHVLARGVVHQVPNAFRRRRRLYHAGIATRLINLVNGLALPGNNQASIRMVHNTVSTFHPVVLTANGILLQQLEVAGAIVIVLEALDGILLVLRVLGIVQRGPRARMGHDIAYLLNPNTLCRVIGRFCNDRRAYSTGAHQCDHRYVCHCHLFHSLILLLLKAFQVESVLTGLHAPVVVSFVFK